METEEKENKLNHVKLWEESGLSMRKYCKTHGISYWSFREWRKRKNTRKLMTKEMIEIPKGIYNQEEDRSIEIIINSKIRLNVRENFDREHLRNIICALEDIS